ncbi:MAG: hypothetical protein V4694_05935 [Pseudomonadota bacterium]
MKSRNPNNELLETPVISDKNDAATAKDLPQTLYYSISCKRFLVFSVITLGFFNIYWFYKHWKSIKNSENSEIIPFLRTLFLVFSCYSLFKKIFKTAKDAGYKSFLPPILISIIYIALVIFSNFIIKTKSIFLSYILWSVPVIPLLAVQHAANYYNEKLKGIVAKKKLSFMTIFATIFFGILIFIVSQADKLLYHAINTLNKTTSELFSTPKVSPGGSLTEALSNLSDEVNKMKEGPKVSIEKPLPAEQAEVVTPQISPEERIRLTNLAAERIKKTLVLPKMINNNTTLTSVDISPEGMLVYQYKISGVNNLMEIINVDASFKNYLSPDLCQEVIANRNTVDFAALFTIKATNETFFIDYLSLPKSCNELAVRKKL